MSTENTDVEYSIEKNSPIDCSTKAVTQNRKAFTILEKNVIICRLENGESNASLAKEYGVGHSTISMILKNKDKIKASFNLNVIKPKRVRKSTQDKVEQALTQWYNRERNRGTHISGTMLLQKANDFAEQLNINFKCTPSWITRFKFRYNILLRGKPTVKPEIRQNLDACIQTNYTEYIFKDQISFLYCGRDDLHNVSVQTDIFISPDKYYRADELEIRNSAPTIVKEEYGSDDQDSEDEFPDRPHFIDPSLMEISIKDEPIEWDYKNEVFVDTKRWTKPIQNGSKPGTGEQNTLCNKTEDKVVSLPSTSEVNWFPMT